ncbi:MAG TPA: ZIP family metal transporter [Candidatus Saccharimonadales bacterium]|nr:ZIP family metal transporter [Candidatus Saccharimonadales bacterium]
MIAVIFTLTMFLAAALGGLFAIKYQKSGFNHILGFTAGVILGVIAFDVLPEMFHIVHEFDLDPIWVMVTLVLGFLGFHIAEKLLLIHHQHETQYGKHRHPQVGMLSALAIGGHSLLDGVGIGLAFQVNPAVGLAVSLALIAHRFADGINTATLMLAHKNSRKRTLQLVFFNGALPLVGALSTLLFTLPEQFLAYYLAFFAGFLLYIGASDILPQAHDEKSDRSTIMLTIFGVAVIFLIVQLVD